MGVRHVLFREGGLAATAAGSTHIAISPADIPFLSKKSLRTVLSAAASLDAGGIEPRRPHARRPARPPLLIPAALRARLLSWPDSARLNQLFEEPDVTVHDLEGFDETILRDVDRPGDLSPMSSRLSHGASAPPRAARPSRDGDRRLGRGLDAAGDHGPHARPARRIDRGDDRRRKIRIARRRGREEASRLPRPSVHARLRRSCRRETTRSARSAAEPRPSFSRSSSALRISSSSARATAAARSRAPRASRDGT